VQALELQQRAAWARANLRRGTSIGQVWEIHSEYPEARLTVGSDPSAGWVIEAPGVRPIHCELFWDGEALWVADTQLAGGVFLDGIRVGDWAQIQGPAELRFGQAAMDVETSVPTHQRMMSSPVAAKPVTVTDAAIPPLRNSSPPVFGGAASDPSIPELEAEKTRLQQGPAVGAGERTEMTALPEAQGMDLRPRLGGGAQLEPHAGEATQMVAMPGAAPAQSASPPRIGRPIGAPPPPPVGPPPMAPPPVAPPPPAVPSPRLPDTPAGVVTRGAPPPPGGFTPPPGPGGFHQPPPPAAAPSDDQSVLSKVWDKVKPEEPQTDGKQALPTRTWILLAVTVLVTVGWLLWDDTPEPAAAPPPAQPAQAVAPAEPDEPDAPDEPTTVEAPEPPPVDAPTPSSPTEAGSDPGDEEDEDGPTLERRASDAYLAGDYATALPLYRQLAAADPDEGAYRAMVRILERRVRDREEN